MVLLKKPLSGKFCPTELRETCVVTVEHPSLIKEFDSTSVYFPPAESALRVNDD